MLLKLWTLELQTKVKRSFAKILQLIEYNSAFLAPILSAASRETLVSCRIRFYYSYFVILQILEYTNPETSSLMFSIFN